MSDQPKSKANLRPSLEETYISIFPLDDGADLSSDDDLWLEQPSAQKTVKSTTSSSSFDLPETFKSD